MGFSSLFEVQRIAHQLILMLSGVDTQSLVAEKAEDMKQLKEAAQAMTDFFTHAEEALSDGVFDRDEFEASKAKLQQLQLEWADVLAEVKDQKPGEPE